MGRYKLSANGGYYDPNDSGPDQFTPTPGQQYPGMPAPQQAQQPPGEDMGPGGIRGPFQPPWMQQPSSGVPTTPGVNGQPVYTGGYDPNSPLYQQGGGGFGQQGGGHYEGIDWDRRWVPDNPTQGQTALDEMRKQFGPPSGPNVSKGTGMPYMIDNTGGGQSPWMTLGSLGQGGGRETGPPPGMSQEAWQQGEDYLNSISQPHTNIFGQQVPGTPRGGGGGSIFGSLGSLGGALGVNGGNVAPKPSGGIAGAIYNKYPDLFKR